MANKLLSIKVAGRKHTYSFNFYGDPDFIPGWRRDGLIVNEIENVIPGIVARLGLTRPWCFWQDLFNFKNPWRR